MNSVRWTMKQKSRFPHGATTYNARHHRCRAARRLGRFDRPLRRLRYIVSDSHKRTNRRIARMHRTVARAVEALRAASDVAIALSAACATRGHSFKKQRRHHVSARTLNTTASSHAHAPLHARSPRPARPRTPRTYGRGRTPK